MTTFPAPAPAPFTFEGVVRLTRTGTTYIIFTIVIGFAALNTGNNALYIGLTFMLGSLLLSGLASKGGLKNLEVSIDDVGEAWAGRRTEAVLRITNGSRLWNVRDIIITSDDMAEPALVPLLERGRLVVVHATLLFRRRGRVELTSVDLYTRYPFGFFMKKRRVKLRGEMIVFPRLLDDHGRRERFRPTTGEQTFVNRAGLGTEIHSFREFASGDSLRHVYWRKSASVGRWIIKQTNLEANRAVHVVVNPYQPPGTSEEEFEQLVSEATTFVHGALERGLEVILEVPGQMLRSKEAQGAPSMFRALALIEPSSKPIETVAGPHTMLFSLESRA